MTSLTKNLKPQTKKLLSFQLQTLAKSFEGFNSSLAQLVEDLCHH